MNKQFFLIILKRFAKGLGSVIGAYALQFVLKEIHFIQESLPGLVNSPMLLMTLSAGLLALEKLLQGYKPE